MNKKILVLGGTGAMGVYLIPELLNMGYEVFVTSRSEKKTNVKNLQYIKGNAKEITFVTDLLKVNEFDAIVDFMIYHTEEFENRVKMLLENTKHYVFLSSYRVYSNNELVPINEETPRLLDVIKDEEYLKTDEYALTKARQENILMKSGLKNWTILRPTITYSKERFQLGPMEAGEFLHRALKGKSIIFPREMLSKETTMSWAGDVAKMIAKVILNEDTYGESYIISTAEHHKWSEVIKYYKEFINMKVKYISLEEYTKIIDRKYQINYDRMYNRIIDNSKILNLTHLNQDDLMLLKDGIRMELTTFSKATNYKAINIEQDKKIDKLTQPKIIKFTKKIIKFVKKIKPRTRIKQIKAFLKSRFKYDGAIVTLTVYNNYGNVIQRFALQRFLEQHKYKFNMLNFHNGIKNKNHNQLRRFVKKYLIQEKFNPRLSKFYKTYIVGSDQVWRHFSINKGWENFGRQFLSFVKNKNTKRIAYAASFGVGTLEEADIVGEQKKKAIPLIKKFDAISVREKSGLDLVAELGYTKSKAVQVLDPTLLIQENVYSSLIENSPCANNKSSSVFYYLIASTPLIEEVIKHYETLMNNKAEGILPYQKGIPLPSMEKWLKGIRDSKIVITDSYHAVVFSLIFHTDFIVFDKMGGGLDRITELLGIVGLTDRIVVQGETEKIEFHKIKPIDWENVEKLLDVERKRSSEWLLNSLRNK